MNEKYIPLYRKYRPQKLSEIVGQEHIKKALTNAIQLNKIAHAYLFTGPRGTGKTSTARILAKSLNCVNGPTINPCGKCASCIDITNSTPIDVIEIDAASNRSVNDAQDILEKIQYAPVNGKYKIYIIDEVHMLSITAFNALLKTLEEPPENVIFILATTEVHKVLDTIKSRCQRFDFKRITTNDIVNHLKNVANLENIKIEDDAILTIAKNSAGGMRDSLALLDQLSVLDVDKAISTDDINSLLGRLSFDTLNKLTDCIINSQPNNAIELLEEIYNSGNETTKILFNILNYFKNLLIVKNCKTELVLELTQTTETQTEILQKQAEKIETQQLTFLLDRTSHYIQELKTTTNQHLWLEVSMIDLANLAENTKLIELQNRIQNLETGTMPEHTSQINYKTPPAPIQKPSMKPANAATIVQQNQPITSNKEDKTVEAPVAKAEDVNIKQSTPQPIDDKIAYAKADLTTMWHELLANITSAPTKSLLQQLAKPVEITPQSVVITIKQEIFVKQWNESNKKQTIVEAVDKMFSQKGSNVIIRLPQPNDNNVSVQQVVQKSQPIKTEEIKNTEQQTNKISSNLPQATQNAQNTQKTDDSGMVEFTEEDMIKDENTAPSDLTKMVKDLFDGKIVG